MVRNTPEPFLFTVSLYSRFDSIAAVLHHMRNDTGPAHRTGICSTGALRPSVRLTQITDTASKQSETERTVEVETCSQRKNSRAP